MALHQIIDIQATLGIQQKFKTITDKELRGAINQETGEKILSGTLSDDTVQALAKSLQMLMKTMDNTASDSVSSSFTKSGDPASRAHQSMSVLSDIACTRSEDQPSLGHVTADVTTGRFAIELDHGESTNRIEFYDLLNDNSKHVLSSKSGSTGYKGSSASSDDQPLDIPWGDVFISIKEKIFTLRKVIVDKIAEGLQVILKLAAKGINYIWNGIVHFTRQAFDVVDALFTWVGCGFQDLFGWLCYLLDWKDIKATAAIFKDYISAFKKDCGASNLSFNQEADSYWLHRIGYMSWFWQTMNFLKVAKIS